MQSTLNDSSADTAIVAVVTSRGPSGESAVRCLRAGECLTVGTSAEADLQLSGTAVAEKHCTLTAKDHAVHIRDHNTATGTLVDGQRVSTTVIRSDRQLTVGNHVLSLMLGGGDGSETTAETASVCPEPLRSAEDVMLAPIVTEFETRPAALEEPVEVETIDELRQLRNALQDAQLENEVLRDRLESATLVVEDDSDPFKDEMIELLRAEVVDLQAALANGQSTSNEPVPDVEQAGDMLSRDESEQLVSRLEQLLLDLEERDQQVRLLDGLLESAEQANQAEQQEREQLDEWVRHIESRFGEREQEWSAERESLQKQICQLTEQRDCAESHVTTDSSDVRVESLQRLVTTLREESTSLEAQLKQAQAHCAQLKQELEESKGEVSREEIVQIARERAELARMRHEIEERSREFSEGGSVDESIERLQALRQHLNEVHAREEEQRRERSLSGRIAKLWKALDGK